MIYKKMRVHASLLVVAGIAVLLVSCGGGSDDEPALTKSQYVKQANQVCKEGLHEKDQKVKAVAEQKGQEALADPEAAQSLIEEAVIPTYDSTIEELKELTPPVNDEETIAKMIGKYDSAMQATKSDPAAAFEKNPFAQADKSAAGYGLSSCVF